MAASKEFSVKITGLVELQKALAKASERMPDVMAGHLLGIAEIVASRVRGVLPGHTSTVTPRAQKRGATVTLGGSHGPWLDMGGSTKRWPGQSNGFQPIHRQWLGKDVQRPAGRYLFPQVSAARDETRAAMEAVVVEVENEAGL